MFTLASFPLFSSPFLSPPPVFFSFLKSQDESCAAISSNCSEGIDVMHNVLRGIFD